MYLLSEEQIKDIAFRSWHHIDPRPEHLARNSFERWWEANSGLYLSEVFGVKKVSDKQCDCLTVDSIY